ncbi:hypothetical protein Mycch_2074 [Mycolicibacterium chubuense NBB4]|uniref:Uncharacterized protein n=1 Tax=Mycolicibacterium chubuense (strain NBB4) TaxID=710421 RepID=I4BHV0_MYCCN|nr:DUF6448 family protein [Mycolicibacterium chubuense]AFM16857.1 hypothetical protein Mycch_2074 [Mycolicibacterium chubuense NBB4]
MPPHCDSMDGPVVTAARRALEAADVEEILPYVHADAEREVRDAFQLTLKARGAGDEARDVADRWFFETVVRLHRAGEGAPFTGLTPAGRDVGPVIPVAERALETESADEVVELLSATVRREATQRHEHAMELKRHATEGVAEAREYVEAMLGFQVWAHGLYQKTMADPHAHSGTRND